MTAAYEYHRPTDLGEAVDLFARSGEDTHLMAGGTALMLLMRQELVRPAHVIHLHDVPELRGIQRTDDGGLKLGALTTHTAAERSADVRSFCPALAEAFRSVATVRIRNQATLGGNLAHADPAQDPAPMLLALDAELRLVSAGGDRTLALTDFFRDVFETAIGSGEIVRDVSLPPLPAGARASYTKFLPRSRDDYATAAVAAVLVLDDSGRCRDTRIGVGAAGPIPFRATDAERALIGRHVTRATAEEVATLAAEAADPIDDIRGSAAYKRQMVRVWTRRALLALGGPS